ncbi:MAG: hypothetical protein OXC95_17890 [Dehalococcoidia bacterium]|nr:hypothetical protein [Dehalococcoidia bacterium]
MNVPQRKRLFELGEDVIAEAVLDVLRTNAPEYLSTSEILDGLGLPRYREGTTHDPERRICDGVLYRLAERRDYVEMMPPASSGQGYKWRYMSGH